MFFQHLGVTAGIVVVDQVTRGRGLAGFGHHFLHAMAVGVVGEGDGLRADYGVGQAVGPVVETNQRRRVGDSMPRLTRLNDRRLQSQ